MLKSDLPAVVVIHLKENRYYKLTNAENLTAVAEWLSRIASDREGIPHAPLSPDGKRPMESALRQARPVRDVSGDTSVIMGGLAIIIPLCTGIGHVTAQAMWRRQERIRQDETMRLKKAEKCN
jgi:hypothetical protein